MTTSKPSECKLIRPDTTYRGKQGFDYFHGISAESVGSVGICMHLLDIPPGQRAETHLHESHETAIYVLSGTGKMWWGQELEHLMEFKSGDMIYIPPGTPHLPANTSESESCIAVIARTDPNEQESVVLRPDLARTVI